MTKVQSLPKAQPPGGFSPGTGTSREIRRLMGQRTSSGRPTKIRSGKVGGAARLDKWRHESKVKKHLQALTVSWLAEQVHKATDGGPKLSGPLYKLASAYANVWDLSQAARADLLKVPGVGAVGLLRVEEYLTSHQVELKWGEDGD